MKNNNSYVLGSIFWPRKPPNVGLKKILKPRICSLHQFTIHILYLVFKILGLELRMKKRRMKNPKDEGSLTLGSTL